MKECSSEFVLFGTFILQRSIIYLLSSETRRLVALIFECFLSMCKLILPCWSHVCSLTVLWWQRSYTELFWLNVQLKKHNMWINIAVITGGRQSSTNLWFDGAGHCFDLDCLSDFSSKVMFCCCLLFSSQVHPLLLVLLIIYTYGTEL